MQNINVQTTKVDEWHLCLFHTKLWNHMIIIAKSLPIKIVMYMSSFFLQAMEKLHHIRKDIEYVYQAWMHGILPVDYMRKWINALQTLVEVIMVKHITNLASHDLIMKIVQNSFTHNSYVSGIDIMHWKHINDT